MFGFYDESWREVVLPISDTCKCGAKVKNPSQHPICMPCCQQRGHEFVHRHGEKSLFCHRCHAREAISWEN